MIGSWYSYAAASDPNKIPYDLNFWRAEGSVVGTALSTWLVLRRSPAALPVAAATALGTISLGSLNKQLTGSYVTRSWRKRSWKEKLFNRAMPLLHGLESAALAGAAALAAPPLAGAPLVKAPWYPFARKLALYYMSFSLVGHWAEIAFCTGIKHGLFKGGYDRSNHMLWDQWLFPFPAEGSAAVLAELALRPANNYVKSFARSHSDAGLIPESPAIALAFTACFLVNQIVCTSVDYTTGMVANRNYELWDYRDMKFHYKGQICLQNSLIYSAVATAAVWWLLPALDILLDRVGDSKLDGALVGFGAFFIFLVMLYHVVPGDTDDGEEASEAEGCAATPEETTSEDVG